MSDFVSLYLHLFLPDFPIKIFTFNNVCVLLVRKALNGKYLSSETEGRFKCKIRIIKES